MTENIPEELSMIKRLRRKFIFINMSLISLVLLIVFASLGYTTYQRVKMESHNAMRQLLTREPGHAPPKFEIGARTPEKRPFPTVPAFCMAVDPAGSIHFVTSDHAEISKELQTQAVTLALKNGNPQGVLSDMNLRFLRMESRDGIRLAFADLSKEEETMASLFFSSLLIGAAGLGAFFCISILLANWALKPMQSVWRQQQQFIADVSHELKTPLTVILANTGILLSHRTDSIQNQVKWIEYIQTEAERMKQLVNDLLFLAKSDAGRTPPPTERLNFSDLIWGSLLPFESVAYEQGITLNSKIQPELFLIGTESELRQLVAVLLDNACKYANPGGSVTVLLEATDKLRLSVNNTGIPIEKEKLSHVFERFYRAEESRWRQSGGYGLGLAIAKQITKRHRGKISVESNEKNGTTFSVSFPKSEV